MRRKWWVLLAVCAATFMLMLDVTIVNVALPDIAEALGASFDDLQWVVNGYALMLAAFVLSAGSLADRLGRRRIFVGGLGLFTVASLLCGLSGSASALNLSRALQGVGAAAMFASSLGLLAHEFDARERGTAFGIWGATNGAAIALGPLVGGTLVEGLGWEWIFLVNVPLGAAVIAIAVRQLRESADPGSSGIDWAGLATFSGALFLFLFALVRGNEEGWGGGLIVGCILGAVALLVTFVAVELAASDPMLDLRLFRKPAFTGAAIVALVLPASIFAMFLYLTLYIQNVLGASPLDAGLWFLPITLVAFLVAPVAGWLANRIPIRVFLGTGLACVGAGLLLMRGLTVGSSGTELLGGFVVAGIGVGLVYPALASTAVGVVPARLSATGSGINATFRQVGVTTGIAGLGALFHRRIDTALGEAAAADARLAGAGLDRAAEAVSAGRIDGLASRAPPGSGRLVATAAEMAFVDALNEILLVAGLVALAGAVLGLVLVRGRDVLAGGDASRGESAGSLMRGVIRAESGGSDR